MKLYLEINFGKVLIVSKTKSLIKRHQSLPFLSAFKVRDILNKHLKYKYKRASKFSMTMMHSILEKYKFIYIQIVPKIKENEII